MAGIILVMFNFTQTFFLPNKEELNDARLFAAWLKKHWTTPGGSVIIYLMTVFSLQKYMKNKKAFDLRRALVLWSGTLATFSVIGAINTVPERLDVLWANGWSYSLCTTIHYTGPVAYWSHLFVLSKVYELGDTIFIVLRKQKLTLLHWYHHVTVLLYTWYSYAEYVTLCRYFIVMNYSVHAVMYSYYTLKCLKIQVPRAGAMCVTIMQILQV